jgi:hypothetical protein
MQVNQRQQQDQRYVSTLRPVESSQVPKPADDGTVMGALALAMSACLPPVGLVLGIIALKKSPSGTPGRTLGLVGLMCSLLSILLFTVYLAFIISTRDYEETEDTQLDYSSAQEL